jgi:Flp pilus assembly pilin Flp
VLYQLIRLVRTHRHDDSGATMVEYAFLVMLIALIAAAAAYAMGGALSDFFLRARNCIVNGTPVC